MKKIPDRKMEIAYIPDEKNNALALKAILKIVQLALESKQNLSERKEDSYEE
ncbi:hypothetical protein LJB89_01470 [Tyzzerella sp. OttesenSCG-928-J15]|nr:hypothetical protein [Tyzzerella sp. OttesenSCG-928-J15]